MSQKAKFIFGTYIVAALVALSLCCAIGYSRLTDYRRAAAYSSRAAFETTVKAVDSMGAAMKKSLYATDGGLCSSLCGQVYASASAAEPTTTAPGACGSVASTSGWPASPTTTTW